MLTVNVFLSLPPETKGGGAYLETPGAVENIVSQTAAAEPSAFEARLAEALMAVFAEGVWELEQVVSTLNRRGCLDREGLAWSAESFQAQLQRSAQLLFKAESP